MKALSGKTSDRIRNGEIPKDSLTYERQPETPSAKAVQNAHGQGLGQGATTGRSGGAS